MWYPSAYLWNIQEGSDLPNWSVNVIRMGNLEHGGAIDTRHCVIMIGSEISVMTGPWKFQELIPPTVMNDSFNETWLSDGHILRSKEFDTKVMPRKPNDHRIPFCRLKLKDQGTTNWPWIPVMIHISQHHNHWRNHRAIWLNHLPYMSSRIIHSSTEECGSSASMKSSIFWVSCMTTSILNYSSRQWLHLSVSPH